MAFVAATAVPASAITGEVVADNLTSPLGFAVAPDGTLYVAEAFAGKLTKIDTSDNRTEIAHAPPGSGTSGVALADNGSVYYTLSLPPEKGTPPETDLAVVKPDGSTHIVASMSDYEAANNPDSINTYGFVKKSECQDVANSLSDFIGPASFTGVVESNPYAVADEGYGSEIVADAAGNDILRVHNGQVSTVAVLPPIPQQMQEKTVRKAMRQINRKLIKHGQEPLPLDTLDPCIGKTYQSNPVPTDVEFGPDGNLYVSTLPGFPENPRTSRVYRVNPNTGAMHVVARDLTGSTDLAVTSDGIIYVAEFGAFEVRRIDPSDPLASTFTYVNCPTAIEATDTDELLVAEGGICGGQDPGKIAKLNFETP